MPDPASGRLQCPYGHARKGAPTFRSRLLSLPPIMTLILNLMTSTSPNLTQMNSSLAEIVIQNIEFLALSSDQDINPDAAIRQLETISSLMKGLPADQLVDFFQKVENRI